MAEESGELEKRTTAGAAVKSSDNSAVRRAGENLEDDALPTDDAQQIRERIEETRSQMSETIDAIQDKLSVANITEQVKDQVSEQIGGAVETVKDAVFGKAEAVAKTIGKSFAQIGKSGASEKVQENPWILSVVGMGIGAVIVGTLFGGKKKKRVSYRYKGSDEYGKRDYTAQTRQSFKSADEPRRSSAPDFRDERTTNYDDSGRAAKAAHRDTGGTAGITYEKTGDSGENMKKNYSSYIEKNPLAVGAAIFAVGAVIGYAIPLTEVENKYFGGMRDNLVEKAQTSAQEAVDSVKQMAGDAKKIITDEVNNQLAAK